MIFYCYNIPIKPPIPVKILLFVPLTDFSPSSMSSSACVILFATDLAYTISMLDSAITF